MKKLILLTIALASLAFAQTKPATFEVASVKPAPPPENGMGRGRPSNDNIMIVDSARVYIRSATLGELINAAFRVRTFQVVGPAWLNATGASAQRFTVQATLPEGASKDQAPEMLQALLIERFHLTFHRVEKEQSVFAMMVAKTGAKLREAGVDEAPTPAAAAGNQKVSQAPMGNTIHMEQDLTMDGLCDLTTRFLDRPVIDATEMKGKYHVTVELSIDDMRTIAARNGNMPMSDAPAAAEPTGSTLVDSLKAMGLRLEPRKANVKQLVIDAVEKMPAEN
jgi:uncharacterized protein (TIGR03435 family)